LKAIWMVIIIAARKMDGNFINCPGSNVKAGATALR
jgi:hypothetical protein